MTLRLLAPSAKNKQQYVAECVKTLRILQGRGFPIDKEAMGRLAAFAWDRGGKDHHLAVLRQVAAIMKSGDRTRQLSAIKAPTLDVHGNVDRLVHLSGDIATASAIAGARLTTNKGMGHDIPARLAPHLADLGV